MGKGKRAADYDEMDFSDFPIKKILLTILILAVLFGIGFGGFILFDYLTNNNEQEEVVQEPEEMIKTLEGYDVLGQIKVDNLDIDTYILDSTEEEALKVAAGKITGDTLNEEGNFCVIGHNYDNIFAKLLEIEKGEEITVIDPKLNETKYEVKNVYTVEPDDLEALLSVQDTVRLTLITCETTASTRLVVVAEEVTETDDVEVTENTITDEKENTVE